MSKAAMILLSLHAGPPSETSAFNRMRAFSNRRAGPFPLWISASSCGRSSPSIQHSSAPNRRATDGSAKWLQSFAPPPALVGNASATRHSHHLGWPFFGRFIATSDSNPEAR